MKLTSAEHFRTRCGVLAPGVRVEVTVNYGDPDSTSLRVTFPGCRPSEYWHCPDAFRALACWLTRDEFSAAV